MALNHAPQESNSNTTTTGMDPATVMQMLSQHDQSLSDLSSKGYDALARTNEANSAADAQKYTQLASVANAALNKASSIGDALQSMAGQVFNGSMEFLSKMLPVPV